MARDSVENRPLPHDKTAEVAVLSGMLNDKRAAEVVVGEVKEHADYFYFEQHQIVYRAAYELYKRDEAIDVVTVSSQLDRRESDREKVSNYDLADIAGRHIMASNVEHHLRLVLDAAMNRGLIVAGYEIVEMGHAHELPADDAVAAAEERIFQLRAQDDGGIVYMPDLMQRTLAKIEERHDAGGGILGIDSGFPQLNEILSGFIKKEFYLVGALPSRGKTTWALQVALHAAKQGHGVAFFSLETHDENIMQRLMSCEAKVNRARMRVGKLNDKEWESIGQSVGRIAELPLYVIDTTDRDALKLKSQARLLKMKHDIDMIFIDYVQLLSYPGRYETRNLELSKISNMMQIMSRELDVSTVCLSQFSRATLREGREPRSSDMRDSGALEQDAYGVLLIHHPSDIGEKEVWYRGVCYQADELKDMVKIIIDKNKDGPTNFILNDYDKEAGRFAEVGGNVEPPLPEEQGTIW